ncbi:MAG: hypothetical protein HQL63_00330 [Magnetococcales bacterium]|nr:hypothetical protein [Magnetococcales bacterium]MBF0322590.1 hypothetical protein [Magnetococcales bacterium]
MSQALTIDDIWNLFQETNHVLQESIQESRASSRELRISIQETNSSLQASKEAWDRQFQASKEAWDRQFQASKEIWDQRFLESRLESARWAQEAEARLERDLQETRRVMQESRAETERISRDTDRKFQETDRQFKETDQKIKEVSTLVGRLGGRWGEFVEGMVAPACETLFAERGFPIHRVSPRIKAKLPNNRHMEIDLLVVNTDMVALVEVKSKPTHEDVQGHLSRLAEFKEFFPEYAHRRVLGAVAGIVIEENVSRYAMNAGLFVLVQSGDTMLLANTATFTPLVW